MSTENKPPMVVWLTGNVLPCEAVPKRHKIWAETGPYVHLDQFLEEVERRLELWKTIVIAGESQEITDKHFKQAALMVAKEIKEGNAP